MLNREHIDFCIDQGVCCLCGKTLKWGQDAVYTINGAHYECQFPEGRPKTLDTRLSELVGRPLKPGEHAVFGTNTQAVPARANGGHVLHWVVPSKGVALCGRYPANSAKRMRKRGMWLPFGTAAAPTWLKSCEKCGTKQERLAPQSQN